ncbi:MAG: DUF2079 domain-containing protein [Candidatus Bathyarchaeota archaeon]
MGFLANRGLSKYDLVVFSSIVVYSLVFSWFTVSKHYSFSTFAWDLGIFDQALWTTVNLNKLFYYTCELHLVESGSFFGVHFSPILFILIPIYYLNQSAVTLLIAQSFILGVSAYPIYLAAKLHFAEKHSAMIVVLYLMNPALHGVNSYDFHVQAFIPLAFNYVLYYIEARKWRSTIIASLLSLTIQEQVAYFIIGYAAYLTATTVKERTLWMREEKKKRFLVAATLTIASVGWILLSTQVIGYFNPEIPEHLKAGQHFTVLGAESPSGIISAAARDPLRAMRALAHDWSEKAAYLLGLTFPYALPLALAPTPLVAALPWIAVSLLSNYPPYYRLGFQYPAYIIPTIYAGFIKGLDHLKLALRGGENRALSRLFITLLVVGAASSVTLSPLSPLTDGFSLSPSYIKPSADPRNQRLQEVLARIPRNASILAQDNLFPHVSNREHAYVIVPEISLDPETWRRAMNITMGLQTDYIVVDLETDPHGTAETAFTLVKRYNYSLHACFDNVYLYGLPPPDGPAIYEPMNETYTPLDLIAMNGKVAPDPTASSGSALAYVNMTHRTRTIWYGPYVIAPEGNYTATFTLKIGALNDTGALTIDARSGGVTLANATVGPMNFTGADTWQPLTLNFTLTTVSTDLELRGLLQGEATSVSLDQIRLTQTGQGKRLKVRRS